MHEQIQLMREALQQATQILVRQTPVKALPALQQALGALQPYFFQEEQSVPPFEDFYAQLYSFFVHSQQPEMPKIEVLKYLQISLENSPFLAASSAPVQRFFDLLLYALGSSCESLRELGFSACRILADKLQMTSDQIARNSLLLLRKQAFQPFLKCCRLMPARELMSEYAFTFAHMKAREIGELILLAKYEQIFDVLMQIRDFLDEVSQEIREEIENLVADRILEGVIYPFVINSLRQHLLEDSHSDDVWLVMRQPDALLYELITVIPEFEIRQDPIREPQPLIACEGVDLVHYLLSPQDIPEKRAFRVCQKASFFLLSEILSAFPDLKLPERLGSPVNASFYTTCKISPGSSSFIKEHFGQFFEKQQSCSLTELFDILRRAVDVADPASVNGYVRCVVQLPGVSFAEGGHEFGAGRVIAPAEEVSGGSVAEVEAAAIQNPPEDVPADSQTAKDTADVEAQEIQGQRRDAVLTAAADAETPPPNPAEDARESASQNDEHPRPPQVSDAPQTPSMPQPPAMAAPADLPSNPAGELIGLVGISSLSHDVIEYIIYNSATNALKEQTRKIQRVADAFSAEREREKEARRARADESVRDVVEQIYARAPPAPGFNKVRSYFEEKWGGDGLDGMKEELRHRKQM